MAVEAAGRARDARDYIAAIASRDFKGPDPVKYSYARALASRAVDAQPDDVDAAAARADDVVEQRTA